VCLSGKARLRNTENNNPGIKRKRVVAQRFDATPWNNEQGLVGNVRKVANQPFTPKAWNRARKWLKQRRLLSRSSSADKDTVWQVVEFRSNAWLRWTAIKSRNCGIDAFVSRASGGELTTAVRARKRVRPWSCHIGHRLARTTPTRIASREGWPQ